MPPFDSYAASPCAKLGCAAFVTGHMLRTIITCGLSGMRSLFLPLALAFVIAAPALADEPVVTLTLKDHQFVPSEVPVPAGVKVKVVVKNEEPRTAEFESKVMHFEKIVGSGREIAVFVGPLDAGSYEFYNDFDHTARGHLIAK